MPLSLSKPNALSAEYARGLFELSEERGGEDGISETLGELEGVLELAREDARFSEFLASRVLAKGDRARSLETIFRGTLGDLTLNFLLVLNAKGRLAGLPAIVASFDELAQARFGKIEVDVYTAGPMSGDELQAVKQRLHEALGKEPVVHPYVDESMIGGVKIQIGDTLIDASVAARLRQVQGRLSGDGINQLRARFNDLLDDAEH